MLIKRATPCWRRNFICLWKRAVFFFSAIDRPCEYKQTTSLPTYPYRITPHGERHKPSPPDDSGISLIFLDILCWYWTAHLPSYFEIHSSHPTPFFLQTGAPPPLPFFFEGYPMLYYWDVLHMIFRVTLQRLFKHPLFYHQASHLQIFAFHDFTVYNKDDVCTLQDSS